MGASSKSVTELDGSGNQVGAQDSGLAIGREGILTQQGASSLSATGDKSKIKINTKLTDNSVITDNSDRSTSLVYDDHSIIDESQEFNFSDNSDRSQRYTNNANNSKSYTSTNNANNSRTHTNNSQTSTTINQFTDAVADTFKSLVSSGAKTASDSLSAIKELSRAQNQTITSVTASRDSGGAVPVLESFKPLIIGVGSLALLSIIIMGKK